MSMELHGAQAIYLSSNLLPPPLGTPTPTLTPLTPEPDRVHLIVAQAYSTYHRKSLRGHEILKTDRIEGLMPSGMLTPRKGSMNVGSSVEELVEKLKNEGYIYEQADILHNLHKMW